VAGPSRSGPPTATRQRLAGRPSPDHDVRNWIRRHARRPRAGSTPPGTTLVAAGAGPPFTGSARALYCVARSAATGCIRRSPHAACVSSPTTAPARSAPVPTRRWPTISSSSRRLSGRPALRSRSCRRSRPTRSPPVRPTSPTTTLRCAGCRPPIAPGWHRGDSPWSGMIMHSVRPGPWDLRHFTVATAIRACGGATSGPACAPDLAHVGDEPEPGNPSRAGRAACAACPLWMPRRPTSACLVRDRDSAATAAEPASGRED